MVEWGVQQTEEQQIARVETETLGEILLKVRDANLAGRKLSKWSIYVCNAEIRCGYCLTPKAAMDRAEESLRNWLKTAEVELSIINRRLAMGEPTDRPGRVLTPEEI